ncbi:hypothetical protein MnTg02_03233 [bacterium MnTg02]|nr:hypothetical protein MnTg02_03233 [bacterium MnTg02]
MAHNRGRHRSEPSLLELGGTPAGKFRRHFVPPRCASGTAGDHIHIVQTEGQENGFFEPFIDTPRPVEFLGNTKLAPVHEVKDGIHSIANITLCVCSNCVALLESAFYLGF